MDLKPTAGKTRVQKSSVRSPGQKNRDATERSRSTKGSAKDGSLDSVSTPKQARSEETLTKILDAAETLILERGLAGVSVQDIVRAAGSSVGGFYGRFRDKGELLLALHERRQRDVQERISDLLDSELLAKASAREVVRACVKMLVAETASRHRMQAAFLQAVVDQPERWLTGIQYRQRLVAMVTEILLARRDQIGHPEPERAVPFAVQAALSLMDQRALFGDVDDTWHTVRDALAPELERLVCAYLGLS